MNPPPSTLRLVAVSDQPIYLRGLSFLAASVPGLSVIGEAANHEDALQLCQMTHPELVLLDLKTAPGGVMTLAEHMQEIHAASRIILMLRPDEESRALDICDCDGMYALSRDMAEEAFKSALEEIARAESPQLADRPIPERLPAPLPHPITYSRQEILTRELMMAGRIQEDLLPEEPPTIPGWELSVRLIPARETSGDFYDFIPLTQHKWGLTMADVTDKGMGAALFMALASTLLRTYANRFPTLPALVHNAVNARILTDSRGATFVTDFYGVLEPLTGRLIFSNAGHPPGYLISTARGRQGVEPLRPTGMALGVSEDAQWKQKIVRFRPGDFLILYTDGITEAQNPQGDFFEEKLLDLLLAQGGRSAQSIRDTVIDAVRSFAGLDSFQDDVAVMVIRRKE